MRTHPEKGAALVLADAHSMQVITTPSVLYATHA